MPHTPRTPGRRTVRFDTPAAVLADVDRLRRGGYRKVGQWSLPQVCQHLATTVGGNLVPPPADAEPTPEQMAMKAKFFGIVLNGAPEGMALAPDRVPPASCDDTAIEALASAFAAFAAYPHDKLLVGRCGPVPVGEVLQLHLAHAAHHLSFLEPTTVRRSLRYASFADVIADVERLRSGYVRSGNWTLPQTCWHLRAVAEALAARPMADATPEVLARRPLFDGLMAGAPLPDGMPAPAELVPPAAATDADVDDYLALLRDRQSRPPGPAMHRLFGPINAGEHAAMTLKHAAHHLSYLVPDGN
jgi:hypothetical protein